MSENQIETRRGVAGLSAVSEVWLGWGLIAVLALADLIGLKLAAMSVKLGPALFAAAGAVLLLIVSWVYSTPRPDPRLSALAMTAAQLVAYTAIAGTLSYVATRAGQPMIDGALVSADRAMGLDWLRYYDWCVARHSVYAVFSIAYNSLIPQLMVVLVVAFAVRPAARGRELFWLFVLTSLGCVLIGGVLPAAGAFVTFKVSPNEPYVRQFLALRNGSLRVIDLRLLQGVVQFPSFHLALAAILTYAARGIRVLFPLLLALNALVIVATPPIGGHHFADLWGGAVLTMAAIAAVRWAQGKDKARNRA